MSTQIPFSITFTPRGGSVATLVADGGWLAALPIFAGEQRVYEAPGMATANEFFKPLGGAILNFELSAELARETNSAARAALLAADVPTHGVLAFDAATWTAEIHAVMDAVDVDLPGDTGEATTVKKFRVAASGAITLTEDEEE